ncbi:MAG: hypothetical protein LAT81_11765 [Oceanicaulis sp.]|nr:hypothetical protein [Oceanicaulis sp.]
MAQRPRHPDKEIGSAVQYAQGKGWRFVKGANHCWGRLYCAFADRDRCRISVWSTPRIAGNHAIAIIRFVVKCPHDPAPPQDAAPP